MKKILSAVVAASSLTAVNAFANSAFDGLYLGGIVNAHTANVSNYTSKTNTYHEFSSDTVYSPALFIGYGTTFGNHLYIGAEVNWSNEGPKFDDKFNDFTFQIKSQSKSKTTKTLGVKVGYVFNENWLASVKYKRGNSDIESNLCVNNNCSSTTSNINLDIQTFAIGLDYKITSNIFATAELGKTTLVDSMTTSAEFYNFGAGLGYRF